MKKHEEDPVLDAQNFLVFEQVYLGELNDIKERITEIQEKIDDRIEKAKEEIRKIKEAER